MTAHLGWQHGYELNVTGRSAIESIAPKIGCVPQTLNDWVKHEQIDKGKREGLCELTSESAI